MYVRKRPLGLYSSRRGPYAGCSVRRLVLRTDSPDPFLNIEDRFRPEAAALASGETRVSALRLGRRSSPIEESVELQGLLRSVRRHKASAGLDRR